MRIGRRTFTAVGTFFLAAATGHVMQNADAIAKRLHPGPATESLTQASLTSATAAPAPAPMPALASLPDFPDLPRLEPLHMTDGVMLAAAVGDTQADYDPPMGAVLKEYDQFGQACAEPALTLTHLRPAMIGLAIAAPCHPGEEITISHSGLTFAALTGSDGSYAATIPALAASGDIQVHFDSGKDLSARTRVPDIGAVRRYALVTRGTSGLALNAFVKGAAFNTAGHLRPGNAGLPTLGLGGYLTSLGDPGLTFPRLAQIFTEPASRSDARVVLMAAVEDDTCGRDLMGTLFAAEGTVVPVAGAVTFAMPGCDAVGDSLAYEVDSAAFAPLAQAASQ